MKSKAIVACFLLLTGCSSDQFPLPVLRYGGMKGDVVKVKESYYDAVEKFGDIYPDELRHVFVSEYTSDGFLKSYAVYRANGDWDYKSENTFEDGRCVKTVGHDRYNGTTENVFVEGRKNYEKWSSTKEEGEKTITEVFYEGLRQICKDEEGRLVYELGYDEDGHVIDQKNYNEGEIVYRKLSEYDSRGLIIKTTEYFSASSDPEVSTYTYPEFDSHDNWITQYIYSSKGVVKTVVKLDITYR